MENLPIKIYRGILLVFFLIFVYAAFTKNKNTGFILILFLITAGIYYYVFMKSDKDDKK